MSEHRNILHLDSHQHRERFLTALASQPGFVCFGDPGRPRGAPCWLSAWPIRTLASSGTEDFHECVTTGLANGVRLAGCLDYELGYWTESAFAKSAPGLADTPPPASAGWYDWQLVPDDHDGLRWQIDLAATADSTILDKLDVLRRQSRAAASAEVAPLTLSPFRADEDEVSYRRKVQRILDYILAGDCYQVNLSQRFQCRFNGDLWQAYRHLTQCIPTGHAAFLRQGEQQVMSISPESFLAIDCDRQVVTRPIKGTRPRGETEEEDQALARSLKESPKDRAENIMIVDLLRNDLGRFCQPGSVRADQLLALESYRNVHHLVSTVSGRLATNCDAISALLQAFPGGSITGAPKIRAMEIIRELETSPRGPYCGSVFHLDGDGTLYSNIAIRTLYARGNTLYCHGGGGIVADSDPAEEYRETLDKVGPLMQALELAFGE